MKILKASVNNGKTKPPARFTEATLLAAMENPVKYMETRDKEAVKTIGETGGLGTVATRADIIEKLFHSFMMEKKENEIHITSKAKQLLELVPEELKKPELTADWEMKLSRIAKGKIRQSDFLHEIRDYTCEIVDEIKSGDEHSDMTILPTKYAHAAERGFWLSTEKTVKCWYVRTENAVIVRPFQEPQMPDAPSAINAWKCM